MKKLLIMLFLFTSCTHTFQVAKTLTDSEGNKYISGQLGFVLADVSGSIERPTSFETSGITLKSLDQIYQNSIKPDYTNEPDAIDALDTYLKNNRVLGVVNDNEIVVIGLYDGLSKNGCDIIKNCTFEIKVSGLSSTSESENYGACEVNKKSCLAKPATDIYIPTDDENSTRSLIKLDE